MKSDKVTWEQEGDVTEDKGRLVYRAGLYRVERVAPERIDNNLAEASSARETRARMGGVTVTPNGWGFVDCDIPHPEEGEAFIRALAGVYGAARRALGGGWTAGIGSIDADGSLDDGRLQRSGQSAIGVVIEYITNFASLNDGRGLSDDEVREATELPGLRKGLIDAARSVVKEFSRGRGELKLRLMFVDAGGKELRLLVGVFDRLQSIAQVYRWEGADIARLGEVNIGSWKASDFEDPEVESAVVARLKALYGGGYDNE